MTASIVVGLGFGDEGKGSIIDWLTRLHKASLVVRFNGGAQCGHNVVTPEGIHHCFAQWGSGTLAGAETLLSRHVVVNPIFALTEAKELEQKGVRSPLALLHVEETAIVTTPYHVAMNRLRELARGRSRHGSCGMGVGETEADRIRGEDDVITAGMLLGSSSHMLRQRLRDCQDRKLAEASELTAGGWPDAASKERATIELDILSDPHVIADTITSFTDFRLGANIVDERWLAKRVAHSPEREVLFEGAQGVLLDEWHGFHPHTTWSTCTAKNAVDLLSKTILAEDIRHIGVMRSFVTRHGDGPLPTEDVFYGSWAKDDHNKHDDWQKNFRAGPMDLMLAHYAVSAAMTGYPRIDSIVLTHADKLTANADWNVCTGYRRWGTGMGQREIKSKFMSDHFLANRHHNLAVQSSLTARLHSAEPILSDFTLKSDPGREAADLLEMELQVPVHGISRGPTWRDKQRIGPGIAGRLDDDKTNQWAARVL